MTKLDKINISGNWFCGQMKQTFAKVEFLTSKTMNMENPILSCPCNSLKQFNMVWFARLECYRYILLRICTNCTVYWNVNSRTWEVLVDLHLVNSQLLLSIWYFCSHYGNLSEENLLTNDLVRSPHFSLDIIH